MRKRLFCVLAVSAVLSGCESLRPFLEQGEEQPAFTVEDRYGDGVVSLRVIRLDRGLFSITDVVLEIRNDGGLPAVIQWSKSAIGQYKESASPFLDGMQYNDAGSPLDERIQPASSSRRILRPSYGIADRGDGQWRTSPMDSSPILIRLCITIGGGERDYRITIDPAAKG